MNFSCPLAIKIFFSDAGTQLLINAMMLRSNSIFLWVDYHLGYETLDISKIWKRLSFDEF